MSLSPINPEDYNKALARLRESPPLIGKQMLGLVGHTRDGSLVFIPSSYEKGYSDSLLPPAQRPYYTLNLGVIGTLSDGTLVFPPSYDSGRTHGSTDLKFAILAEGEKRLIQQHLEFEANQRQVKDDFEAKLSQAFSKVKQLQEEVDSLKKEGKQ